LKRAGLRAAGVALDNIDPKRHDTFRGFKGAYQNAVNALQYFQNAGVFTYVNMCLTNEIIRSGDIYRYFDLMKSLNVGFVRWLEPKPCGAYFENEGESCVLGENERKIAADLYIRANTGESYRDYPVISYEAYVESPENLGCIMGGNSLIYIDSAGNVEPCVFLPVSFGNILDEDFSVIFERMRNAIPGPLKKECPAVTLSSEIRNLKEKGYSLPISFEEMSLI
jgi:MoaA/NifB/PqqE/SkfB family radical SAM enzyme